MSTVTRQTFQATFRGTPVRYVQTNKVFSTTSIHEGMYAVLTYPMYGQGDVSQEPKVYSTFKTAETCRRTVRENPALRQFRGQTFVVPLHPGTTEISEQEPVDGAGY